MNGNWSLIIGDVKAGNVGSLIDWMIEIKWCGDSEVTFPEECDGSEGCNSNCKCDNGYYTDRNLNVCVQNSTYKLLLRGVVEQLSYFTSLW